MLLLAPAALLLSVFVIGLAVYTGLWFTGRVPAAKGVKHNEFFGPFFGQFLVWMCKPLEWLFLGRISANTITAVSMLLCLGSGIAAATGHFTAAAWMFALGGILDAVDGRIARLNGEQTQAGALYDSVGDRWGDFAVGLGLAWYLRETPWMLAAMIATGGSMMVSYTRARAEGLGIELRGGMMQRAERVVLISLGTFLAAGLAVYGKGAYVVPVLGVTMTILAVTSVFTAITRWVAAYRMLQARDAAKPAAAKPVVKPVTAPPASEPATIFPVPAKLRESAEMGL